MFLLNVRHHGGDLRTVLIQVIWCNIQVIWCIDNPVGVPQSFGEEVYFTLLFLFYTPMLDLQHGESLLLSVCLFYLH